jgi:hypothetical protein
MTGKRNKRKFKIFPSITTTSDYLNQVKEINELALAAVCLFPTGIDYTKRKKLYGLLEKSSVKEIPFVHIRHDMREEELRYLKDRFKTRLFNIHSQLKSHFILENDLSEYNKFIYVETTRHPLEAALNNYAGICLDTAHVENQRLKKTKLYESLIQSLNKHPVGITHISAIAKKPRLENGDVNYDDHKYKALSEFDYVLGYTKYLSEVIALELENSVYDQLKAKSYLENLLSSN